MPLLKFQPSQHFAADNRMPASYGSSGSDLIHLDRVMNLSRVTSHNAHRGPSRYHVLLDFGQLEFREFCLVKCKVCRSQLPRGLRRGSAAARLLRLWVRIPPGAWMSVVIVVCCQVEVSATG